MDNNVYSNIWIWTAVPILTTRGHDCQYSVDQKGQGQSKM